MKYCIFDEPQEKYDIAILIKPSSFNKELMEKYYVKLMEFIGLGNLRVIAYELEYNSKKVKAKEGKAYLAELKEILTDLQVKYIYVADAEYFKLLTGLKKGEAHLNEIIPVDDFYVTIGINYSSIKYNPLNRDKLKMSLETIKAHLNDTYSKVGSNIIHHHILSTDSILNNQIYQSLHHYNYITCDIESYSLDFFHAGISTIGFGIDQHRGAVISCDYHNNHLPNYTVREELKQFFKDYKGKIIFHNANYDVKVLIYTLFMKHDLDYVGMQEGLTVFKDKIIDTKIIAYLALNSTYKPSLGLKDLALTFAGNYAEDVKDVRKIPLDRLAKYNLIDCLSTQWVYDTYYPKLIEEDLLDLYSTLMMDSVHLLLEVELVGIPINLDRVEEVKQELLLTVEQSYAMFDLFQEIQDTMEFIRQEEVNKSNSKLKKTKHTIDMPKYAEITFNPNSSKHLQVLLYKIMDLPILKLTETKQPSTSGEALKELLDICKDTQKPLLEAILDYASVAKILSSFIPAFEKARKKDNGHWLHGGFNIGGTVSGRLSSSQP